MVFSGAALLIGWLAFTRIRVSRPPLGVLDVGDVVVMLSLVILVPGLYLVLPVPIVVGIFLVAIASALQILLSPLFRSNLTTMLVIASLLGADAASTMLLGPRHPVFLLVNNSVLVLTVASTGVLWAHSGLRARDAALLGGALGLYDLVATVLLPLTNDLLDRLAGIPFTPIVAWATDDAGAFASVGFGDLLAATLFPLVVRKAYGRTTGVAATSVSFGVLASLLLLGAAGVLHGTFPVMVALGPLLVLQYAWFNPRCGPERTTAQYLLAESEPPPGHRRRPA